MRPQLSQKRNGPCFDCSKVEHDILNKIADRYLAILRKHNSEYIPKKSDMLMDLTAAHCGDAPLRLDDLLHADDFNLAHDCGGIYKHLNRVTGDMEGCFMPRFIDTEAFNVRHGQFERL